MPRLNQRRVLESPLNVDLPHELRAELNVFCEARKVKIKTVVEAALRRFMAAPEPKVRSPRG